jgi:hypothetical protein
VDNKEEVDIYFRKIVPAAFATDDVLKPHIPIIHEFRNRMAKKESCFPVVKPIVTDDIMQQFENVDKIIFSSKVEREEFEKLPISTKPTFPECAKCYFIYVLIKNIQEILVVSSFLPYSDLEVAKSIQTSFWLVFNYRVHNLSLNEDLMRTSPYEGKVVGLEYEDAVGIVSKCCAPSSYFDNVSNMTKVRRQFNNRYPQYKLGKNSQLFQFVHDIRKIMSLKETIDLWASIIVPSEVFFRSKTSRILNPYYLKTIGYD